MRLLLVEDDLELADGLVHALAQSGHACDHVTTVRETHAAVAATQYDLLILDLGLPDGDGLDLLGALRANGLRAPVLILTARDGVEDRIRGLDRGGDDYLAKPFALGELEARIRALSRRRVEPALPLQLGRLQFDVAARTASVDGHAIDLTARELAVLTCLLRHPGRTVSKQQLFEALYTWEAEANLSVIEVYISRLRRKLEAAQAAVGIRVLRGLGYRLEVQNDV